MRRRTIVGLTTLIGLALCAGPAWAVDRYVNATGTCGGGTPCHTTIQDAIDAADPGDVIHVEPGTYSGDLVISTDNLELLGDDTDCTLTTIEGVTMTDTWPGGTYNIDILASGVRVHGFTIQGPDPVSGFASLGMLIGGDNVVVAHNCFEVTNAASTADISQGIQTIRDSAGRDVDGLNIHDNTFTHHGAGGPDGGYEAVFINHVLGDPTPAGTVTIADNTFGGDLFRGISTERSNVTISGNVIRTTLDPGFPGGWQGINVRNFLGTEQKDVTVTGNTLGGTSGFGQALRVGLSLGQTMSNIIVTGNDFQCCNDIQVQDTAEVLDIQGVLDNNTFDKAVVVSGSPLLHTIWSSIQDAIDAASAGNTVHVMSGTYTENLTIDKALSLLGGTTIDGTILVTSGGVTIDGFTLAPSSPAVIITIDSSASAIAGVAITNNVFEMPTSPVVAIWVGGGTPTNIVSGVDIIGNTFNGPSDDISNPFKIGGGFGAPLSARVDDVEFSGNTVNDGSIPINLQDVDISNVVIDDNTFNSTDGLVYVWGQGTPGTPTGVLSGFKFTNNSADSSNSYGVGIDLSGAEVFDDDNFGLGNQVTGNSFVGIPGAYGFGSVSLLSPVTTYVLDAENNWWGAPGGPSDPTGSVEVLWPDDCPDTDVIKNEESCVGLGGGVSENVDYCPWLMGSFGDCDCDGARDFEENFAFWSGCVDLGGDPCECLDPIDLDKDGVPDDCVSDVPAGTCCTPSDGSTCPLDDGNGCTDDACSDPDGVHGECLHTGNDDLCDDENDCTVDTCDPNTAPISRGGISVVDGCVHTPEPRGTTCGDSSDTDCDKPDTCDGAGVCLANPEPPTTECRAAVGECDIAEFCDGEGDCPADGFEPPDTPCGDPTDTVCDNPDSCDGNGTCFDNYEPTTTECRADVGECDVAEFCNGEGGCPEDIVEPPTTVCRTGSGDMCDPDELCTGVADEGCPPDHYEPDTTVCNPGSGDLCDPDEFCPGTPGGACPSDIVEPLTTVCRTGSGDMCDPDELCTGVADEGCPPDHYEPDTTVCNPGSGDLCDPDEFCPGTPKATCPEDAIAPDGTVCNPGSGDLCDPDEVCSGEADAPCPVDIFEPSTTVCDVGSGDLCDPDEFCPGVPDVPCPEDAIAPQGTVCNPGSGDMCDPDEKCSGEADVPCPDDIFEPSTTVCRSSVGDCDIEESCPEVADQGCPGDVKSTDLCRPALDECDVDEFCDGVNEDCPIDDFAPPATPCGDPRDTDCDKPDTCDGAGVCLANPEPPATPCPDDQLSCTDDVCDGGGECTHPELCPGRDDCPFRSVCPDAAFHLAVLEEPSSLSCADGQPGCSETNPPASCDTLLSCGDTFFVEIWVTKFSPDLDSAPPVDPGVACAYVDLLSHVPVEAQIGFEYGAAFNAGPSFESGVFDGSGGVMDLGACSTADGGVGVWPKWVLLARVELQQTHGQTLSFELQESALFSTSIFGEGAADPVDYGQQCDSEVLCAAHEYDVEEDMFVGPGDLACLAGCWLLCPGDDGYDTGACRGESCDTVNYVNCSPTDCVGPEDFAFWVTCWMRCCDDEACVLVPDDICDSSLLARFEDLPPLPSDTQLRSFGLDSPSADWKGYKRGVLREMRRWEALHADVDVTRIKKRGESKGTGRTGER